MSPGSSSRKLPVSYIVTGVHNFSHNQYLPRNLLQSCAYLRGRAKLTRRSGSAVTKSITLIFYSLQISNKIQSHHTKTFSLRNPTYKPATIVNRKKKNRFNTTAVRKNPICTFHDCANLPNKRDFANLLMWRSRVAPEELALVVGFFRHFFTYMTGKDGLTFLASCFPPHLKSEEGNQKFASLRSLLF